MWVKALTGNHYGVFEVVGVELYRESDDSFILYAYLSRPVPQIPVGIDRGLRDGMGHTDFIKLHEFTSEEAARQEIDSIQAFINDGAQGVYEVRARGGAGLAA